MTGFNFSRGQILVPSLFVFPGLVLFAILIVEVAKLSQQKVLMQFAMDTSAFMEASQLSDAANRIAYLNSPWPTRVFQAKGEELELWNWQVSGGPGGGGTSYAWQYLLKNGVYPGSWPVNQAPDPAMVDDRDDPWSGKFKITNPGGSAAEFLGKRAAFNYTESPDSDLGTWVLFTKEDVDGEGSQGGLGAQLKQEDVFAIYQTVAEVYSYFYSLATMVKLVYTKLHGVFFKKTFWLNTGFNPSDDLVPEKVKIQDHCTSKVTSWFTVMVPTAWAEVPDTRKWPPADITLGGQPRCSNGAGIWQLSTIEELKGSHPKIFHFGKYHYQGPSNHFGVDYRELFNGMEPYVTASAEVSGGKIWPNSKPSFQVRLRP
ncbi:MAG: hypothetical protein AAB091_07175 [Elusimicrobiota bacterium]